MRTDIISSISECRRPLLINGKGWADTLPAVTGSSQLKHKNMMKKTLLILSVAACPINAAQADYIHGLFSIHTPEGALWSKAQYLYVQGDYFSGNSHLPPDVTSLDLALISNGYDSLMMHSPDYGAKVPCGEITVTPLGADTILVVYKLPPEAVYGGSFVFNFNLKDRSKTTGYYISSTPE
jgi:hypothetical protein